jgi:hypothetical protein
MRRRYARGGSPLAERAYFVRDRGLEGWIESNRNPVLWVLSGTCGVWTLRDVRKVGRNDWVLPFLEFPRVRWFYLDTFEGEPQACVKQVARFAATPPFRSNEPVPIEDQVLAAWEQVELPM